MMPLVFAPLFLGASISVDTLLTFISHQHLQRKMATGEIRCSRHRLLLHTLTRPRHRRHWCLTLLCHLRATRHAPLLPVLHLNLIASQDEIATETWRFHPPMKAIVPSILPAPHPNLVDGATAVPTEKTLSPHYLRAFTENALPRCATALKKTTRHRRATEAPGAVVPQPRRERSDA
jgi:hypothetical protein